jgi:flagellar biosynthesis protein FlhF
MADRDLILIDTAGRGQRDLLKVKELNGFFNAVRPHEVHLVLSTTCSEAVLRETIDRFADAGIDRVIFTKLDEALGFGVILSCLQKASARLSYVTTGQDVPDDIEVGEGRALAELILGPGAPSRATALAG